MISLNLYKTPVKKDPQFIDNIYVGSEIGWGGECQEENRKKIHKKLYQDPWFYALSPQVRLKEK